MAELGEFLRDDWTAPYTGGAPDAPTIDQVAIREPAEEQDSRPRWEIRRTHEQIQGTAGDLMNSGLPAIEALIQRLDTERDLEVVRRDAVRLVLHHLESMQEPLDSWEKMHFEMAIALLPTVWLRLSLTHLRMALEPPSSELRAQVQRDHSNQFESITLAELLERARRLGQ